MLGGPGEADATAVVQPVMVWTHQNQIVEFSRAAVFPVLQVMGVQTAGGATPRHHAAPVAMLEGAA